MEIKLNKKVHGKKGFGKVNDMEFRELASDAKKFSLEKFFKLYNRMFFNIPKEGEESHTSIFERSRDYVRNYVDPLQFKVDKLTEMLCNVETIKTIKESHVLTILRYFDLIKELKEVNK